MTLNMWLTESVKPELHDWKFFLDCETHKLTTCRMAPSDIFRMKLSARGRQLSRTYSGERNHDLDEVPWNPNMERCLVCGKEVQI